MEYLSISQTATKLEISKSGIQTLCVQGRIPGSKKIGSYWAIPENAVKPKDERIKSGKYVKSKVGKNDDQAGSVNSLIYK